jgi:hypothetical protein
MGIRAFSLSSIRQKRATVETPPPRRETGPGNAHLECGDTGQVFCPAAFIFHVGNAMPMVAVTTEALWSWLSVRWPS